MAIARDATNYTGFSTGTHSSWTHSHTTSGTDRYLFASIHERNEGEDRITSVTYNGTSMTRIIRLAGQFDAVYLYGLVNPDTGTHNVVANISPTNNVGGNIITGSYTGVDQSSPLGASGSAPTTNATSRTITLTTTVDNSWLISTALNNSTSFSAGTNTSLWNNTNVSRVFADSNGPNSPAGDYGQTLSTSPTSADITMVAAVLQPVVASTRRIFNIS